MEGFDLLRKSVTTAIDASETATRSWCVYVNGQLLPNVASVVIDHPRFGTLTYGRTAQGYDGLTFHEYLGGGSVILPFVILDNQSLVGVVLQDRPNQGGNVWNAPRGFDPGEDRRISAARELAEEVGLRAATTEVVSLPGQAGNPNSAFFETWDNDEGVTFFGIEVDSALVTSASGEVIFAPGAIDQSPGVVRSRNAEAISRAVCSLVRSGTAWRPIHECGCRPLTRDFGQRGRFPCD